MRLLEDAGYEVVAVACGTAALAAWQQALAQERPFAAALLDLTVPGGDGGKETMPKLLAMDPSAKGIVISGYSDDPVLANYQRYGFVARIAKPFCVERLLSVLASVTEKNAAAAGPA